MDKSYDLIVSLGGNCSVAMQLSWRNKRPFSLALDWTFMPDGWRHDGVASLKRFPHGVYTTERTPEEFFGNNIDAVQAYNKAKDEVGNYKKGNYDYQSGKGWVKK